MSNGLNLNIGANIRDLVRGLQEAKNEVKSFGEDVKSGGARATDELSDKLSKVGNAASQVVPEIGGFSAALGSGGALGAIFLVSAAINTLKEKYGSLGNAIQVIINKNDDFKLSHLELAKAMAENLGKAEAEKVTLSELASELTSATSSYNQRVNAFREIKKEYPGILQGMTEEMRLTKEQEKQLLSNTAVELKLIELKAQRQALAEAASKEFTKQLEAQQDFDRTLKSTKTTFGAFVQILKQATGIGDTFEKIAAKAQDGAEGFKYFSEKIGNVTKQINDLSPAIVNATGGAKGGKGKESPISKAFGFEELDYKFKDALNKYQEFQDKLSKIRKGGPVKGGEVNQSNEVTANIAGMAQFKDNVQATYNLLSGSLTGAVNDFFTAIATGSNVFQKFGDIAINVIKHLLTQLIQAVAEAAIMTAILGAFGGTGKGVLNSEGGFGGILSGLLGFGKKHAAGGVVTSPQVGMIGEAGPEAIIPLNKFFSFIHDLQAPNLSGIKQGGMQLSGQLVGRGNDLIAVINQSSRSNGRSF